MYNTPNPPTGGPVQPLPAGVYQAMPGLLVPPTRTAWNGAPGNLTAAPAYRNHPSYVIVAAVHDVRAVAAGQRRQGTAPWEVDTR